MKSELLESIKASLKALADKSFAAMGTSEAQGTFMDLRTADALAEAAKEMDEEDAIAVIDGILKLMVNERLPEVWNLL